jgi:hypothetical protein
MKNALAAALVVAGFTALPSQAFAEDLTFQLTNRSSFTILQFFTSPATTDNWEEDVFGEGVFPSGNTVPVTIADGSEQCVYDMKFVPDGAAEFVVEGIDLCQLDGNEYTLTDAE